MPVTLAVVEDGKPVTARRTTGAGFTVMPPCVAVSAPFEVSATDSDCVPRLAKVTWKVPVPPFRGVSAGKTAWGSLLVKWRVPLSPVAVLPYGSLAVTVKVCAMPRVTVSGRPAIVKVLAGAGLTAMLALVSPVPPVTTVEVSTTETD